MLTLLFSVIFTYQGAAAHKIVKTLFSARQGEIYHKVIFYASPLLSFSWDKNVFLHSLSQAMQEKKVLKTKCL